jgi:hypothetical protein
MTLSITLLCHYAECRILFIVMLIVIMPSVFMLYVIMDCRGAFPLMFNGTYVLTYLIKVRLKSITVTLFKIVASMKVTLGKMARHSG